VESILLFHRRHFFNNLQYFFVSTQQVLFREPRFYAITVIFNPAHSRSRVRLYHEFKKYMEFSGIKLLTVEVAFGERDFECTVPDDKWNMQFRSRHLIWLKENLVNLAMRHLDKIAPHWTKAAWIDADVKFTNVNWVKDAELALDHYDVIQLYSQAGHLNSKNEIMWTCKSVFHDYVHKKGFHQFPPVPHHYYTGGHPGLAWAARRDAMEKIGGMIDFTISGSGDLFFANSLMGDVEMSIKPGMTDAMRKRLKEHQSLCDKHIKGNIGFIWGACIDYWHGASESRGYTKRWDVMNFHQFDPNKDIYKDEQGLWAWSGNKPQLEQDLRLSTFARNEDWIEP
jgi:hypothetical protein